MASSRPLDPPPARGGLIGVALVIVVLLLYGARLPFGLAILGAVPCIGLFLAAPWLGARSLRAFDRDVTLLLAQGKTGELPDRYRRAWGMRLFVPTPLRHERRGLAYGEADAPEEALRAYREAVSAYDEMRATPSVSALHGWARLSGQQGRWDESVVAWRRLRKLGASVPDLDERLAEAERLSAEGTAPGRDGAPVDSVPPRPAER